MWDLVLWWRIKPGSPLGALEAQHLSHWTTKEVPIYIFDVCDVEEEKLFFLQNKHIFIESIVNLQCCVSFWYIPKRFSYIFFFRFFSIITYYKVLNIVSYFCCSVPKLCPTLCCRIHCLPEFAQIHSHWVSDAIQPSHPLALNLSQHQGLFQWFNSSYKMAKV